MIVCCKWGKGGTHEASEKFPSKRKKCVARLQPVGAKVPCVATLESVWAKVPRVATLQPVGAEVPSGVRIQPVGNEVPNVARFQPFGGEVPNVVTLQPVWLFGINGIIKKKQIESNSMNSFICRRSSRKQLPEWMKDYVSLFAVNFFGNSEYKPLNTLNIVGKTE